MSLIQKPGKENNPYYQLLMIIFYALAGVTVFLLIAILILFAVYGMELIKNPSILSFRGPQYRPALQLTLVAQSVGLFLVPAILLAVTERKKITSFYEFKKPTFKLIGLVFVIMVICMPFMEWTVMVNQKMVLPHFLKGVEEWMRRSEDSLMKTTLMLLKMNGIGDFLLTMFIIAIVPAICEEFMFRGALQRTFIRIFKNYHVAIWVSAAIFSAIHMQFYGFLPRLLLGAGFGYIYHWSGSLWYTIFAHFLNNGYEICVAWYMQKNNIPLSQADNTATFTWYAWLISAILTLLAFIYFKNKTSTPYEQQLD